MSCRYRVSNGLCHPPFSSYFVPAYCSMYIWPCGKGSLLRHTPLGFYAGIAQKLWCTWDLWKSERVQLAESTATHIWLPGPVLGVKEDMHTTWSSNFRSNIPLSYRQYLVAPTSFFNSGTAIDCHCHQFAQIIRPSCTEGGRIWKGVGRSSEAGKQVVKIGLWSVVRKCERRCFLVGKFRS